MATLPQFFPGPDPGRVIVWCDAPGCFQPGMACDPPTTDPDAPPEYPDFFCADHARANGYCPVCGQFWGGISTFEAWGLCDHCRDELRDDSDEGLGDDDWGGDLDPYGDYE